MFGKMCVFGKISKEITRALNFKTLLGQNKKFDILSLLKFLFLKTNQVD
jgi:hypothetical protein